MNNLNLEKFVDVYVGSALEIIQRRGSLSLDDFYNYIFQEVSERTGLSREDIKHLHHAFHWSLFLRIDSPFDIFISKKNEENYHLKIKNGIPEKYTLVSQILKEYKGWLEARLEKLRQSQT